MNKVIIMKEIEMKDIKSLDKRYETVAWGTGFLWIGILGLIPGDQDAVGVLGIGFVLLSLLVDTVFFLICAADAGEQSIWLTSLFYLYVLLSAALLHTTREVFIVVGVSLAFFFIAKPTATLVFSPTLLLAGTAASILAMHLKGVQERLGEAARQADNLRVEAELASEAERQRIAADFHDGPLQSFVGMQMRLEVLKKLLERDPQAAAEELASLQQLCTSQTAELRAFVRGMRPVEVDGAGLLPSIRKLVAGFEKESGFAATMLDGRVPPGIDHDTALEVLQVVREALHNAQKHARASHVTVGVTEENGTLELCIEDDGQGFPFSGAFTLEELENLRLGPLSIRRRVRNLGGDLTLESRPGSGSTLRVRVPV